MKRLYYGWVLVGVLSLTVTVSYGILMYTFSVVLAPMEAELGWTQSVLTGGFSVAALTAGIVAIPVGRWVDRYGARVVMSTGSAASTLLLLAWSRVQDPLGYYVVWVGLGACMAAVFYEPAFAVVAHWFRDHRGTAFTIITLAGALASTIFVPLTSWLVVAGGWREAVVWLAVTMGLLTILPHALLLRHRPSDLGLERDGAARMSAGTHTAPEPSVAARVALRSVRFRWLGSAFFLSAAANFAIAVHLVPLLLARGWSLSFAAAALALLGLAKLPGRLLLAPVTRRLSTATATVLVFALQAVALIALISIHSEAGVWIFVALFGAGDGASTPARAGIVADFFGSIEYGRISGVLAFFNAFGRAAAPVGASLAYVAFGGYDVVLWILAGVVVGAAVAMTRAVTSPGGGAGAMAFAGAGPRTSREAVRPSGA